MKRILSMLAVVMTLGLSTAALDAEAAKRLGSGKSVGTQRQVTQDKAPAATAQPATAGAPAAAGAAAPAAAGGRSWMAPVAGLAAGLGLAALASHLGFGEELASMVMMGLLAAAVVMVVAFVMRRRAGASASPSQGPQYAYAGAASGAGSGMGADARDVRNTAVQRSALQPAASGGGSMIGSALGAAAGGSGHIPAGFDTASFERHACDNFVRLQAANDAGDLNEIGRFTTPELLAALRQDLAERDGTPQRTEVLSVSAQVLDVEESDQAYVVSVRLSGEIREGQGAAEPFAEIWHLSKPRDGAAGWLLAGIQQVQ